MSTNRRRPRPGSESEPATESELRGALLEARTRLRELEAQNESLSRLHARSEETRRKLHALFDGAPVAYVTVDRSGTIRDANGAAGSLLGLSVQDLPGRRLTRKVAEKDALRFLRFLALVFSREQRAHAEFELIDGSGASRVVRIDAVRVEGEEAATCRMSLADVTAERLEEARRREAEAQLRQTQKLEAVGRLAAGVAQHVNNLLMVVQGNAERIAEGDGAKQGAAAAEEILHAVSEASDLVNRLLTLGRPYRFRRDAVDLQRFITDLEAHLLEFVPAHIRFESTRPDDPMFVRVDPADLEQALLHLVANACDAMPEGGTLSLACRPATDDELPSNSAATGDRTVVIELRDTGVGMDSRTFERAFEPFFTTKHEGSGLGLGLATAYALVNSSGGRITARSRPGLGTTFRLFFTAAGRPSGRAPVARPAVLATGEGVVLVCEDVANERKLFANVLGRCGYQVLSARDGSEALALARDSGSRIDVVVTDLAMPGMDGLELARRVDDLHPGVGVVLMSGYAEDSVDEDVRSRGWTFLQKPFALAALADKVRELAIRGKA